MDLSPNALGMIVVSFTMCGEDGFGCSYHTSRTTKVANAIPSNSTVRVHFDTAPACICFDGPYLAMFSHFTELPDRAYRVRPCILAEDFD
jgi:hypothetical protein